MTNAETLACFYKIVVLGNAADELSVPSTVTMETRLEMRALVERSIASLERLSSELLRGDGEWLRNPSEIVDAADPLAASTAGGPPSPRAGAGTTNRAA